VEMRTKIKDKIYLVLFKIDNKHGFTNFYGKAGIERLSKIELQNACGTETR